MLAVAKEINIYAFIAASIARVCGCLSFWVCLGILNCFATVDGNAAFNLALFCLMGNREFPCFSWKQGLTPGISLPSDAMQAKWKPAWLLSVSRWTFLSLAKHKYCVAQQIGMRKDWCTNVSRLTLYFMVIQLKIGFLKKNILPEELTGSSHDPYLVSACANLMVLHLSQQVLHGDTCFHCNSWCLSRAIKLKCWHALLWIPKWELEEGGGSLVPSTYISNHLEAKL